MSQVAAVLTSGGQCFCSLCQNTWSSDGEVVLIVNPSLDGEAPNFLSWQTMLPGYRYLAAEFFPSVERNL